MAQTSLVTGANRGIGLELARQLKERGDDVIATARTPESASELNGLGVRVEALDVESPKSISALARKLKGAPVDLLIHNAAVGVAGPAVEEVTAEDLESHFRVNAVGPLLLTQALLPNLRASEDPRIVAVSSGLGSISENSSGGWVAYRVSKVALHQVIANARGRAREREDDLRPHLTGLGPHPHGRTVRAALARGERARRAQGRGSSGAEGHRKILQRARPRDPLVERAPASCV